MERGGGGETDEPVHLVPQGDDRALRRDRNGEHQCRGACLPQGFRRSFGRSARGNAVIDNDDIAPAWRNSRLIAQIEDAAAREFEPLPLGLRLDVLLGRTDDTHCLGIEDDLRLVAVDQRSETEFGMTGCADLANDEEFEGGGEGSCHLEGHRHAAARQRHHQRVGEVRFLGEMRFDGASKPSTRIGPVCKGYVCKGYAFLGHDIAP